MKAEDAVRKLAAFDPAFALNVGDLGRSGGLPPGRSSFALERLAVLREITPEGDDVDVEFFKHCVELESFALLELGEKLKNPDVLSPLCDWAMTLSFAPFSTEQERGERMRAFLAEVPFFLAEAATTFGEPDALWLDIAIEVASGVPALFASIAHHFRAEKEAAAAAAALKDFVRALRSLKGREGARVLERDTFAKLLQLKDLPYDLQEIEELGRDLIGSLEEKRQALAKAFTGYPDARNALRALEQDQQTDALREVQVLAREARDFCGERDLVPFPSDEELLVVQTPEYARPLIPFAAISVPKPLWPMQRSMYFVTAPGSRADMRNTVPHEAYPGHHLQFAVANTQGSLWRNAPWTSALHAQMGVDTIEGWAHYCEALMKTYGFYRGPDDLFQGCNDAVWRAHRILLDVELSTGAITLENAAQRLVERVGMAPKAAMSEVRRYTLMPGYNLCYALGKHVIRDLRKEAERAWGNAYSLRRFHALIMTNGSAPLAFAKKRL